MKKLSYIAASNGLRQDNNLIRNTIEFGLYVIFARRSMAGGY